MQVPIAQQQVDYQPPHANEPQISTPIDMGQVDVAKANEAVAKGVMDLSTVVAQHAVRQNQWKQEEQVYDSAEKYRVDAQNVLYGGGTRSIKGSDGKSYDIPDGLLKRNLTQADGATTEYDQRMAALKQNYLKTVNNPMAQKMLVRHLDGIYATYRGEVIRHEADQRNKSVENTFTSALSNQVNQSAMFDNPNDLKMSMANINDTFNKLAIYKGMDAETADKNRSIWLSKAVDKSTTNTLMKTGNLDQAQAVLDSVKDQIGLDDYDKISKKLVQGNDVMQKQALKVNNERQTKNALQLFDGLSSGQVNWQHIDDIDAMDVSEPTKIALKAAIDAESKYPSNGIDAKKIYSIKDQDRPFANHIADVMKSGDQDKVVNVMNEALRGFGKNTISQDRLNIISQLALQRAKNLPGMVAENAVKSMDPKAVQFDAGMNSLMEWTAKSGIKDPELYKSYMDAIKHGAAPKIAHDDAIKSTVLKHYPQAVSIDNIPNMVLDKSGPVRAVFPRTTTVYPEKIYDPKTKTFKVNPNREISSQDEVK